MRTAPAGELPTLHLPPVAHTMASDGDAQPGTYGSSIGVVCDYRGSLEITFADFQIQRPQSMMVLPVADHGKLELRCNSGTLHGGSLDILRLKNRRNPSSVVSTP